MLSFIRGKGRSHLGKGRLVVYIVRKKQGEKSGLTPSANYLLPRGKKGMPIPRRRGEKRSMKELKRVGGLAESRPS